MMILQQHSTISPEKYIFQFTYIQTLQSFFVHMKGIKCKTLTKLLASLPQAIGFLKRCRESWHWIRYIWQSGGTSRSAYAFYRPCWNIFAKIPATSSSSRPPMPPPWCPGFATEKSTTESKNSAQRHISTAILVNETIFQPFTNGFLFVRNGNWWTSGWLKFVYKIFYITHLRKINYIIFLKRPELNPFKTHI